jgi:hypothetical protein
MLSRDEEREGNAIQFMEGIANHNSEGRIYHSEADRDYAIMKYGIDIDATIVLTELDIDKLEQFYYKIIGEEVENSTETETKKLDEILTMETPLVLHSNN